MKTPPFYTAIGQEGGTVDSAPARRKIIRVSILGMLTPGIRKLLHAHNITYVTHTKDY